MAAFMRLFLPGLGFALTSLFLHKASIAERPGSVRHWDQRV
jgi:hypothetical protein